MKLTPVEFDTGEGFPVPKILSWHRIDDKNLLIAPKVPAWVVADDKEREVIERLSAGATIGEAIICLESFGVPNAETYLSELLSRLAISDFIEPTDSQVPVDETTIQIHVTNKCNLRCNHCYVSSGAAFPKEVGLETWIKVIDEAKRRYRDVYVSISGGEPLLVSWLPELLHHTKKLGIRTSVLSNGMLWSTKRVAQLGDLVDLVNVSLDGASAEIHDEIRGRGSFRQAVRGIQRLGEAGIEVGINICLMKSNARDVVDNLFDLVESFPFHVSVSFAKFVVEGRGLQNAEQSLSGHDLGKVLSELAKQFLGSKWVPTSPSKRFSCGFGKLYAIYANGDVSPCLSPRFIAANITETPIRDVFDQISSNAKGADVDGLPLCRTCDLRYICGGRCHLPQVTQGEAIAQNNCSSSYRRNFYATLARRASIQDEVMLPILNRVI